MDKYVDDGIAFSNDMNTKVYSEKTLMRTLELAQIELYVSEVKIINLFLTLI